MIKPVISHDPLYRLLRDGEVEAFNERIAAGQVTDLTACDFTGFQLPGLNVKNLDFRDAYFQDADLSGIDFRDCKSLEGACFYGATIIGCCFPENLTAEEILLSVRYGTRLRYRSR